MPRDNHAHKVKKLSHHEDMKGTKKGRKVRHVRTFVPEQGTRKEFGETK